MKDLKKYAEGVTDDLDDFFAEMMKDSTYRNGVNAEKAKLASAAAILEAREAAGLSQQSLADKSGVPKSTISRIGCKLVPETTFKRGYNKSIVS